MVYFVPFLTIIYYYYLVQRFRFTPKVMANQLAGDQGTQL